MERWWWCIPARMVSGGRVDSWLWRSRWEASLGFIVRLTTVQRCGPWICVAFILHFIWRYPRTKTMVGFLIPKLVLLELKWVIDQQKNYYHDVHSHSRTSAVWSADQICPHPICKSDTCTKNRWARLTWTIIFFPDSPRTTRVWPQEKLSIFQKEYRGKSREKAGSARI